ncbi:hypothetical protein HY989_06165 [Candidatus Micrarchaeota archaeon]|nr:hypothetical protein [Candidatus Micrarchaeota archaeon]
MHEFESERGIARVLKNGKVAILPTKMAKPTERQILELVSGNLSKSEDKALFEEIRNKNEESLNVEKELFKEIHPVSARYNLLMHRDSRGKRYKLIDIDNLALNPREFQNLPRHIRSISIGVDKLHPENGPIKRINLWGTWLLSDPQMFSIFKRKAESLNYSLVPASGNLSDSEYLHSISKALHKFKARARKASLTKNEFDQLSKAYSGLKIAAGNSDRKSATKLLSSIAKTAGPKTLSAIFPKLFRNYYLTPKA